MAGRSEDDVISFLDSEEIRDRNRLVMGDKEAVLRAKGGAPALDLHAHSWLSQVNGTLAAFSMSAGVAGQPFLVGSPSQLCGLVVSL